MKSNKPMRLKRYVHYGIIMVVCYFSFFINNQAIPADLMEARNLATAQEMVQYGNYLLPTLNGEPRFEKPPLPTWIAAGIEHLFPDNLGAQRYAAGLMATLMVVFLYLLMNRLTRHRGISLFTSLILATSVNVILMGRNATWDIYTHSFMLCGIYYLVVALVELGAQWKNFLLAGLFFGLSFLSKGPISLYALLLPFLISYFIVFKMDKSPYTNDSLTFFRPTVEGKKLAIVGMVAVSLLVSLWWYGYTWLFQPENMSGMVQKETSAWISRNTRPWYYYWQFAAEGGIWALFWVTAIFYFLKRNLTIYRQESKLAFLWFLISIVLLSLFPEKKARYLLPVLIPGAMLIGFYFKRMVGGIKTKSDIVVFRLLVMAIAIILMALPIALYLLFFRNHHVSLWIQIIATIGSWGLCAFMIHALFGKKEVRTDSVFIGMILTMMMIGSVYLIPVGTLFINEERHSMHLLRDNQDIAGLTGYYNEKEELRMELVYEANRRFYRMNTEDNEAVNQSLPFLLISGESIEKLMSGKKVSIELIGTFDNNWRKKGDKRYNPDLVREAAVISEKIKVKSEK